MPLETYIMYALHPFSAVRTKIPVRYTFITALGLAHISKKQKHKFPHFCFH